MINFALTLGLVSICNLTVGLVLEKSQMESYGLLICGKVATWFYSHESFSEEAVLY